LQDFIFGRKNLDNISVSRPVLWRQLRLNSGCLLNLVNQMHPLVPKLQFWNAFARETPVSCYLK